MIDGVKLTLIDHLLQVGDLDDRHPIAFEQNPHSLELARVNTVGKGREFFALPVEDWVRTDSAKKRFDLVLVDPPRTGLGKPVRDPTSGFVGVNRRALEVFRQSFPLEYPEIEALVVLQRRRFRFEEVSCHMRPRTTGQSSITALKSLYYVVHVLLGVFVNVLKFDRRFHRGPRGGGAGG